LWFFGVQVEKGQPDIRAAIVFWLVPEPHILKGVCADGKGQEIIG
jgi:hypothetical protein